MTNGVRCLLRVDSLDFDLLLHEYRLSELELFLSANVNSKDGDVLLELSIQELNTFRVTAHEMLDTHEGGSFTN